MGMLGCVVVGADFGNAVVPTPLPRPDCDAEHNSPANRARLARLVLGGLQIQRFFSWLLGTEHFSFEDSEVTFNESHEPLDLVQAHDRHRKYPQPPATWGSKRSCTTPTAEPAMLTVEDPEPPLTAEEQHEPDGGSVNSSPTTIIFGRSVGLECKCFHHTTLARAGHDPHRKPRGFP